MQNKSNNETKCRTADPLVYDGSAAVTARCSHLWITLEEGFFYNKATDCFCIPLRAESTRTDADYFQCLSLHNEANDLHRGWEEGPYGPFRALIHVPREKLRANGGSVTIPLDVSVSVCGVPSGEDLPLQISLQAEPQDERDRERAIAGYRTIDLDELWTIWESGRYDPAIDMKSLFCERLDQIGPDRYDEYQCLWYNALVLRKENGYRAEDRETGVWARLESVYLCDWGSPAEDRANPVFSLLLGPIGEEPDRTEIPSREDKDARSIPYEGEKTIRILADPNHFRFSDGKWQADFVRLGIDDSNMRSCRNGGMMESCEYNLILIPGDELLEELPRCPFSREGCARLEEESWDAPAWLDT